MSVSSVVRFGFRALTIVFWVATHGTVIQAQQRGGTVQTDKVQPLNSGANPYRAIRDWATLSLEKRALGRFQWRGHRPRWQVRVGDRSVLAWDNPGCP